jgi:ribosomal-protein-alanine N-acetyltransferase
MAGFVLETPRLRLRPLHRSDLVAIHACMSDPEVMRYWSTPPHETEAETIAWLEDSVTAIEAGTATEYAITLDGLVLGKAGLWNGREIGYFLRRSHWRQGFAREALRAVIADAFSRSTEPITADIDPRNESSLKLLLSLGFAKTGEAQATFRIGQVWMDSLYLTLRPQNAVRPD